MDVLSACPLRVASLAWQPRPGANALTVVCKATYALLPGTAPLAEVQEEPHALDVGWGDEPRGSLHHAADLVPFKRRADVSLVGHAYAPAGRSVAALTARLVVGEVDKEIAVYGSRVFMADGKLGEPSPFTKMPLRWERAAGGPGTMNPVGMSLAAPADRLGRVLVPNLQPPGARLASRADVLAPIGFGPVAPGWPGRLAHLRRHASSWDPARWQERPLPDDFDAGYFNAAPPDQQTSDIALEVRLILTNLHPEHPRLVTTLQPIVPRAVCTPGSGVAREIRLRCDTLSIDTDRAIVSLVWRGIVTLEHPAQVGQIVVTAEGAAAPASVRAEPAAGHAATTAFDLASLPARQALPFGPGSGVPSSLAQPGPAAALLGLAAAHARFGGTTDIDPAAVRARVPLPFGAGSGVVSIAEPPPSSPGLPGLAAAHARFGGTVGVDPAVVQAHVALPFVPGSGVVPSAEPTASSALPGLAAAHARFGGTVGIDPAVVRARVALPFGPPGAVVVPPGVVARESPPFSSIEAVPLSAPASELPAPPPMIGPLATADMGTPGKEEKVAEVPAVVQPEEVAAAVPIEQRLPLDAYPAERCAGIAASLARRRAEREAILHENDLDEEVWGALEQHWAEAIRAAGARGKTGLLRAYDEAYLAQLEAERGAVSVQEYARILVAAERGTEREALAELGLPRGALLRLQRVWMRKMAGARELGKRVREAVEGVRER